MTVINPRGVGSLINAIARQTRDPVEPAPGVPATIVMWSDRYPARVSRVSESGATIWVQSCKVETTPGACNAFTEMQSWEIGEPYGPEQVYTRRKNGKFVAKGSPRRGGCVLLIGHAEMYRDPSF